MFRCFASVDPFHFPPTSILWEHFPLTSKNTLQIIARIKMCCCRMTHAHTVDKTTEINGAPSMCSCYRDSRTKLDSSSAAVRLQLSCADTFISHFLLKSPKKDKLLPPRVSTCHLFSFSVYILITALIVDD